jgi:zinc protease
MTNRLRVRVLAAVLTCVAGAALAAQQTPAAPSLSQPLPVDPAVTTGQFDNGLKYFIRKNVLPAGRAELRLVVDVGSIVEDPDQLGLAHFVEHMAFNGTKNFPKLETVAFLESLGMRFGPSINAFTSFDETVYMLQVPTEKPEVLARAMLVLEDWAHNVSFDPTEIDKERGVIIEEWRLRRGAGQRMQDQQLPTLLKGSLYADRLPIGTIENLQTFKHESLTRFYRDWYRPDLMTVVAVGDFDPVAVQQLITTHFAQLPKATNPRPRPAVAVPPQPGTLYAVASDEEATNTTVSVYGKMALRDQQTVGAYRRSIVEGLFAGMLNARFGEMAQKPDAPFLAAAAGRGLFVKTAEASMLNALVTDDGIERGLTALYAEAERVARFGFTETEFARQKTNLLRNLEQAVAEKDKRQSAGFADEYVRAVTQGEAIPGLDYEVQLSRQLLPVITLSEVNALAAEWVPEGNRVVMVSAPKKAGVTLPTEQALGSAIDAAKTAALTAYVDTVTGTTLMDTLPKPGTVTASTTRDWGITEWTLSNGVKVVIKPTDFKQDEILVRAFSPGGASLASDTDFHSQEAAAQLIGLGGIGTYSNLELGKVITGKVAGASASIGELEEGISGRASIKDLETMFQLIHMRFTAPRADPVIFGVFLNQMKTIMANQRAQPEFVFTETLQETMFQGHVRRKMPTAEQIAALSLDKAFAFYKDRFADASDFTFVFVGTVNPDTLKSLVEQYLGSLPSTGRKETFRDLGITKPKGVVEKVVEKGIEPKSQTSLTFHGPFVYNQEQRVAIRAMTDVLQTRLREALREELGGTYSVGVSAGTERVPQSQFTVGVSFGSDPANADVLAKRVFDEIAKFKTEGPTEKQVTDVKAALTRDFETAIKQNTYVLGQLVGKYQAGEAPESLLEVPSYYEKLSAASIVAAAKTYLDTANYVKVVLMPEKK